MKKSLRKAVYAGISCVMALSMTACSGNTGGSPSTAAPSESTTAGSTQAASGGEKKVIKLFHRFPDDPANSFIEKKVGNMKLLTLTLILKLPVPRISLTKKRSK